jgi:Eco57I restriction-modification methylase
MTVSESHPKRAADARRRPSTDRESSALRRLTSAWGTPDSVSLYLQRCQVATPERLVEATWRHVHDVRSEVEKVIDFGAGDGRFARHGKYRSYIGYEIDSRLCKGGLLPSNARLVNRCAFSDDVADADVCIGNPPFVRNQDLPSGWRQNASQVLQRRSNVAISGLANAWQYFFLLALASVHAEGLCALVIPYEWVSRPSSKAVREYIAAQKWNVAVYRLVDTTFNSVLTTSSITIVDKAMREGRWSYFEETASGKYSPLVSPSGATDGVLPYLRRSKHLADVPQAKRGLSPGTQKALTLTEGERVRAGLAVGRDVVPCLTTLRHLPDDVRELSTELLHDHYRTAGQRCWLIRPDREPSAPLAAYLRAVPPADYQTATCLGRDVWWKFVMPPVPQVLISMSFKDRFPKVVRNDACVRAVGGVYGIYGLSDEQSDAVTRWPMELNIGDRVVAHANGLRKIEIGQLNSLLADAFDPEGHATA